MANLVVAKCNKHLSGYHKSWFDSLNTVFSLFDYGTYILNIEHLNKMMCHSRCDYCSSYYCHGEWYIHSASYSYVSYVAHTEYFHCIGGAKDVYVSTSRKPCLYVHC